jgi:UDP:flavonoid glycosyltransferase YjiC (YdhE family)
MYDGRPADSLAPEVLEFCRAGTPPVAITCGTGMMHARDTFRAALAACRTLGLRGIVLTKYQHQLPAPLPSFVRAFPFAPFGQLFPLCAAVVHHGGVGTGAKALASGTPQLVLPLAFDQLDNAKRMKRLGVGQWLKSNQRSSSHIAAALAKLMTPESRSRCRQIAAQFGDHDALQTAAQWIEEFALSHRPSGLFNG